MTYTVRTVVGRSPNGSTDYDEMRKKTALTREEAIKLAFSMPGTKDVFDSSGPVDKRVARVHVDGGVDHYRDDLP